VNLQFHIWDAIAEIKVKTKSHDLERYLQKLYLLIISILNLNNIIYDPKWQSKYIFMYFFFKEPEAESFGQAHNIERNIHSCNPPASTLIKYEFPQFLQ
jgi:hypothetical protein